MEPTIASGPTSRFATAARAARSLAPLRRHDLDKTSGAPCAMPMRDTVRRSSLLVQEAGYRAKLRPRERARTFIRVMSAYQCTITGAIDAVVWPLPSCP